MKGIIKRHWIWQDSTLPYTHRLVLSQFCFIGSDGIFQESKLKNLSKKELFTTPCGTFIFRLFCLCAAHSDKWYNFHDAISYFIILVTVEVNLIKAKPKTSLMNFINLTILQKKKWLKYKSYDFTFPTINQYTLFSSFTFVSISLTPASLQVQFLD